MDIDSTYAQLVTEVKTVEPRGNGRLSWWRVEFFDGTVRIIAREATGLLWVYLERAALFLDMGDETVALHYVREAAAVSAVLNEG